MEQRSCTLGADLGTTSVKVVAYDSAGREIAHAARLLKLWHDDEGAAEQDPREVAAAVAATLGQTAEAATHAGYTVGRLGISAAMHSLIPVAADGSPLMRALTWADLRASHEATALWATHQGRAIYERTGTPVHAMSPLVKLIWLRTHRPEVFARAERFVSLKEWIWHEWFGEWSVDASIASATGLYNLRQRTWDAEALALAGIEPRHLSTLVSTTYVRRATHLPWQPAGPGDAPIDCNIGASDGVLANLGVGAIDSHSMVITIGTSLAVRMGSAAPVTDVASRAFCYELAEGRYIVGGPSNNGGQVLDWLAHGLLCGHAAPPAGGAAPDAPDPLVALIAAAEHTSSRDLLFLPYVAGERAPLWRSDATGVLLGLRVQDSAVEVMRAAVEGIIFNAYTIAARLFAQMGRPAVLVTSGGVLDTPWIRQLAADVFGLPVLDPRSADASALGAARLAEIATGQRSWEEVARLPQTGPLLQPDPAAATSYAAKYTRFSRLADALVGDLADIYLPPPAADTAPTSGGRT